MSTQTVWAAMREAAEQFEQYARNHEAKTPPDAEKAATNRQWAQRLRDVLAEDMREANCMWVRKDDKVVWRRIKHIEQMIPELHGMSQRSIPEVRFGEELLWLPGDPVPVVVSRSSQDA